MNKTEKNFLKIEKEHQRIYDFYSEEIKIKKKYPFLIGIDEVGRGALAGPLYIACVCLPSGAYIEYLNDSKKISEKKRKKISIEIKKHSFFYSYGYSTVDEIEKYNINQATYIAIEKAIKKIKYNINYILLDGSIYPNNFKYKGKSIVKGDSIMPSIAAASILAKIKRDEIMLELDKKYPEYDFKNNKGYGTKKHYEAINKFGLTKHHRNSFLKRYL